MVSSAYVSCMVGGQAYTYHFTGVTGIEHNLALNLNNASAQGTDIVNGARNLPDQVTLTVVETDAEHSPGWAAAMLNVMSSLKRRRLLCRVSTSMGVYDNMLLTEITATQDEENQVDRHREFSEPAVMEEEESIEMQALREVGECLTGRLAEVYEAMIQEQAGGKVRLKKKDVSDKWDVKPPQITKDQEKIMKLVRRRAEEIRREEE